MIMKILVLVSQTPDTTTKVLIGADKKSLDETGITWILNPYSEFAIEKALRLKDFDANFEEIILLSMGPERNVEALRQGLAMGADRAILIKSNSVNTSVLAEIIKSIKPDLILAGKKSIDTESSWLESGVCAELDLPYVHCANQVEWIDSRLKVSREISGSLQVFTLSLPAFVTCDKGNDEPRYASIMGIMKAKKKPLDLIDSSAEDGFGIKIQSAEIPAGRGQVKIFDGTNSEAVRNLLVALKDEAKVF
jgi:electron transfer flavoprotein beta subunit